MSGSIAAIPMSVQGINPWAGYEAYNKAQTSMLAPDLARAEIAQKGAQTGLLGAQQQQAEMANQWQKARLDAFQGGVSPGAPPGIGNSLPVAAAGGAATPYGVMPAQTWLGISSSQEPGKALAEWQSYKTTAIRQLAMGTIGPGGKVDPQIWDQHVAVAYQQHLIDGQTAQRYLGHPELAAGVIQQYVPPELNAQVGGARAGAVEQAGVGPKLQVAGGTADIESRNALVPTTERDSSGNVIAVTTSRRAVLDADAARRGQAPQTGASLLTPDDRQSNFARNTVAWENPGGNPAQRNTSGPGGRPMSTAMGNGQFTEETWSEAVHKYAPTLAAGKSEAQIQAMRADPDFTNQMIDVRGDEVYNGLKGSFKGGIVPEAAVGLGFRYGPAGARTLMAANPNATLAQVLPDAAASNPAWADKTVKQIADEAKQRFGIRPYASTKPAAQPGYQVAQTGGAVQPPPGQPAAAAPAPAAPAAPAGPTGLGVGVNVNNPRQQMQQNVEQAGAESAQAANVKQVTEYQDKHNAQADAANQGNAQIDQIRLSSQTWTSGKFADHKMAALAAFDDIRNNFNAVVGRDVLGKPSEAVANWTDFNKNATGLVSKAVLAVSPRAAFAEFQMIAKGQPQDTTSPAALRQIFDQLQGVNDFAMAKAKAAADIDKVTGSPGKFEAEFNNKYSVEAFILHRASFEDAHRMADAMGKTAEGREYMKHVIDQMNELEQKGYFPNSRPIPTGKQR